MAAQELTKTVLKDNANLKAYYRFESGALTTDTQGTHTLTAISDPALGTGVFGGGVDFDGDDAYSIVDHADLKPTTFSLSLRFKTSAAGVTDALYQAYRYDGSANVFGFLVFMNTSNQVVFRSGTGTAFNDLTTTPTYNDGNWHHLVCTFDGTTKRIYVDGVHVTSVGWANTIGWTGTIRHRIAAQNDSGTDANFFTGSMDDLALFNALVLSADQIKELYEGRYLGELRPNQYGTTVALYHLSSTTDASGNNNHLTNGSAVTFSPGKLGNKATLGAGANDVLYIGSNLGITSATLSFGGWFKNRTEIGAGTYTFLAHWDNTSKSSKEINYEYNAGTRRLVFQRVRQGVGIDNCVFNVTMGTANWYHLAVVMDGSNIYGYVNGNQVATVASSGNGSSSTNDLFLIGCTSSSNAGLVVANMAVADADECSVSSTALTANQIRQMYAIGVNKYY